MDTLQPRSSFRKIKPSDQPTEFEIQAGLYVALKQNGFNVRGEVNWREKEFHCRFDIVILDKDGNAIMIIEVKTPRTKKCKPIEQTRQGRKYALFGVPVTFLYGPKDGSDFFEAQLAARGA